MPQLEVEFFWLSLTLYASVRGRASGLSLSLYASVRGRVSR